MKNIIIAALLSTPFLAFANDSESLETYDRLGICSATDAAPGFSLEIYSKRAEVTQGIILFRNDEGGDVMISETKIDWDREYPLVYQNKFKLSVTISDEDSSFATADFGDVTASVECEYWQ